MSKVDMECKENLELSKSLTKENNEIFTNIVVYLRMSDLSGEEIEKIISDILRMFLDCQQEGKSIESMVGGEDYKKFTEDIISAVNPKKTVSKKVKKYLPVVVGMFFVLLTMNFVFLNLSKLLKGNLDFKLPYNCTLYMLINAIMIVIIAFTMVNYIGKNSFELTKIRVSRRKHYIFRLSAGGLFILYILCSLLLKRTLSNIVILSINIRFIIGIIVVFWTYVVVKKVSEII